MARHGTLDALVPSPAADEDLLRRVAGRARRRGAAVVRRWNRSSAGRFVEWSTARPSLLALLRDRSEAGRAFCASGETRGFLHAAEDLLALLDAAAAARANRRDSSTWLRLMDRAADLGVLGDLAPRGRLPHDFPARASHLAITGLRRLAEEIPRLLIPWLARPARRGAVALRFREIPDLGRSAREILFPGAGLRLARRRGAASSLRCRLSPSALLVAATAVPYPERPSDRSTSTAPAIGALRCSAAARARVGPRVPGFERRVPAALRLLEEIWPDAARMVRSKTWLVVPVDDAATVSFSSSRLPGVSYIHVGSRPAVRLAEDLLHEAAHEYLHDVEAVASLVTRQALVEDGRRFWSPWRREWRPIRGMAHGAYTFTVGARFFQRLLDDGDRGRPRLSASRRDRVRRRLLEEIENVRVACAALREGRRAGLLTAAGTRLLRLVERESRSLRRACTAARRELLCSARGRREHGAWREHVRSLRRRPDRWGGRDADPDVPAVRVR